MLIRQFEVGDFNIFSYLVGDEEAREGLFIDPSDDCDRLLAEAESHGLAIRYIVNTHHHIDHTMGNRAMARRTGAKIVIHEADAPGLLDTPQDMLQMFRAEASPPADLLVRDGDLIQVGSVALRVIHTPGHTPGCICLYTEGVLFTGDTLFVGSTGRTDFPGGSWEALERSIREKIYTLPDDTAILPGHNYAGRPTSTVGEEKRTNAVIRA